MKQRGLRNYVVSNVTSIPFVVTKSITPSHNIGVNIQQVLNGMKMQQPISNIPLSIAHHMGLRHTPSCGSLLKTKQEPSLERENINLIKLGHRLLRLPSYKYVSYRRLLRMYQEGDGMVPKFLKSISRPSYFYQPMYSEEARGDGQCESYPALSNRGSRHEVKKKLEEYANLNREWQALSQNNKGDRETERKMKELERELAMREEHIRQVLLSYNEVANTSALRASASTLGGLESPRSGYRLNTASEI